MRGVLNSLARLARRGLAFHPRPARRICAPGRTGVEFRKVFLIRTIMTVICFALPARENVPGRELSDEVSPQLGCQNGWKKPFW